MTIGTNPSPLSPDVPSVTLPSRAVIDYRGTESGGRRDSSGETIRQVQQALVFFGLLGFGVGVFGGFHGNAVTIPDLERVVGAFMLLGCTIGYVVLRAISTRTHNAGRIALSLSSASSVFGAAVACTCRFPDHPLDNLGMLAVGLVVMIIGAAVFAFTRFAMKRR